MKKAIILFICGILLLSGIFKCGIYQIFGVPCPTCGITRAFWLLFKGNIKGAFLMHPLFWLPLIFIFKPCRKKWIILIVIIIFSIVYFLRMILLFPTTPPMVYNYNSILGAILR